MSDMSSLVPPAPKGPVVSPAPSSRHPFYVVHNPFPVVLGEKSFPRGAVLRGADALAFEVAVANGEVNANAATPTPHDVDPEA